MADTAQLKYNTSLTVNLDVLAVHGAAEPDHVSKFPGIVHEMLDGSLAEQIAGGRREMSIDFQVMTVLNRRKVVLWWLDPDRQIVCLAATPASPNSELIAGGSLVNGTTYYYKLVAVDVIGNSIASSEVSGTATVVYGSIRLTCTAVVNARCYKIYRKVSVGGTYQLFDYATTNSYTDDGTVTALRNETPPTATSVISVITTNDLEFAWAYETELARMLHLELREASIFLSASGFPI